MKFPLFMRTMTPRKFLSAEISLVNPWLATDHVCTQHKTNAYIYIKKKFNHYNFIIKIFFFL